MRLRSWDAAGIYVVMYGASLVGKMNLAPILQMAPVEHQRREMNSGL
jgi:hypothetical protein